MQADVRCYDCKPIKDWRYFCEECADELMIRHRADHPGHRPELTITHELPSLVNLIRTAANRF